MATLIHLNGAPGVGKSTIAERYVAEHPGVLNADIDRLRRLVGGWQDDFGGTGELVRPVALAMIRAHLDGGHDVVLPQMLARKSERIRFEAVAAKGGHAYRHVLLEAPPGVAVSRFYARPDGDPLHSAIREIVDGDGGPAAITDLERRLAASAASGGAVHLAAGDDVDATYRRLLAVLGKVPAMPELGRVAWPPDPIRTERLVLRETMAQDRAGVIELNASPEVRAYLGGPQPRDELERTVPAVPGRRAGVFAVEREGELIGTIHVMRRDGQRPGHLRPEGDELELGYLFLPSAWGHGYATEACAAALDWCASAFRGEPVLLCTQTANAASMRVAARLGFTEVERFEEFGAEQWLGVRAVEGS